MPATSLRNSRGRFASSAPIDVRSEKQVPKLEELIAAGPITFVLVYADWCGHCHEYMPTWKEFENAPGRTANIAKVHHDMLENVPTIKNAKIQGYPSVIRVEPSGKITDYKVPGSPEEVTNAMPNMRDEQVMMKELKAATATAAAAAAAPPTPALRGPARDSGEPGVQDEVADVGDLNAKGALLPLPQSGGGASIAAAFMSAVQAAGPAALLLAATSLLPRRNRSLRSRTYKSPKRSSRRGSTRRMRR
jgi:thiol-disulfide isomerase/thioredoxin